MEEEENRRELIKKRDVRFLLLSRILNVIESKHSMSIRLKARWPAIVLASLVFGARIHRFGFTWFERCLLIVFLIVLMLWPIQKFERRM